MQEASEYLELSLSGKWGSIARKWLEKNAPCTVEDYLVSVSRFMPTHILRGGSERISQIGLARSALVRINPPIVDGFIQKPKRHSAKGYTERIREAALKNGYVVRSDFQDIENFSSLAGGLAKQGLLTKASDRRWILAETINTESK